MSHHILLDSNGNHDQAVAVGCMYSPCGRWQYLSLVKIFHQLLCRGHKRHTFSGGTSRIFRYFQLADSLTSACSTLQHHDEKTLSNCCQQFVTVQNSFIMHHGKWICRFCHDAGYHHEKHVLMSHSEFWS